MGSGSNLLAHLAPAKILFGAIVASLGGITLLLSFIVLRRWVRGRYFARRDAVAAYVRSQWEWLICSNPLPRQFRLPGLGRDVLEAILLDRIAVERKEGLSALIDCLRRSGALDVRILEARSTESWKRRAALVVLGRTRAPESVPALAEALDSPDVETRIAAVRGLAKIADPMAAAPMLSRFASETLDVPWGVLRNGLLSCCEQQPELLCRYVRSTDGQRRDLLARVLAEIADNAQADELIVMAGDESAEIRAGAARGLARVRPAIALAPLAQLAEDPEWFVRLRAVVALATFLEQGAVPLLTRRLCDRNRLVRQRAAWALIRSPRLLAEVVRMVIALGDDYGLQAMVAELDRCAAYASLLEQLKRAGEERLLESLDAARLRLSPQPGATTEPPLDKAAKEVCVA